jgi:hypothetical protein
VRVFRRGFRSVDNYAILEQLIGLNDGSRPCDCESGRRILTDVVCDVRQRWLQAFYIRGDFRCFFPTTTFVVVFVVPVGASRVVGSFTKV